MIATKQTRVPSTIAACLLLLGALPASAIPSISSGARSGSKAGTTGCRNAPRNLVGLRQGIRRRLGLSVQADSEPGSGVDPVLAGLKIANPVTGLIKPLMSPLSKIQAGNFDSAATQSLIDSEVSSNPVVVYSYSLSPFCTKAVELLKKQGANPKVVDMGLEWIPGLISRQGAAIRAQLGATTGRTSMPHIFIGGKSIGGLVDGDPGLLPLVEKGKLNDMLKKAGAI